MALSLFQRDVCRLLARTRVANGESYLAGGATLNELLAAPRLSRAAARTVVALLPAEEAGRAVLDEGGRLFRGDAADLRLSLARGALRFHAGSIRGALPRLA
jgi:hypothetical protein